MHDSTLSDETSIMFENKIFFSIHDYTNWHLKLYEFHLATSDVATEMLGLDSEADIF